MVYILGEFLGLYGSNDVYIFKRIHWSMYVMNITKEYTYMLIQIGCEYQS
jgi:hypothetical protein